jgi:hypothetical protein
MFMSINCGKGVCEMQHISKPIAVIVFLAILVTMALWQPGWEMFAATMSGCALIAFFWGVFVGGNPIGTLFQVAAGLAVIGWAVTYGAVIWLPAIIGAAVLGWSRRVPARFGRMAAGALGGAIIGGVVTITAGTLVTSALATIIAYWWVGAVVIGGVLALAAWRVSRNPDRDVARAGLKRLAIGTGAVAAIGGLLFFDAGSWGVGESGASGSARSNTMLTVPKPPTQAAPRSAPPAVIDLDAPAVVDLDGGGGEVVDLDAQGDSSAVVDLDGAAVRPARRSDRASPPQTGEIGASAGLVIGSPGSDWQAGLGWLRTALLWAALAFACLFCVLKGLAKIAPILSRPVLRGPITLLESWSRDNTSVWLWIADMIQFNRVMTRNIPSISGAYGSSRLLSEAEILRNWGKDGGFVIGEMKTKRRWWRFWSWQGQRHVLSYSGNGSILIEAAPEQGKTSGAIIPTLLNPNPESRVVLDIKGELVWTTAGYRRSCGQRVLVMDPHRITLEGRAGEDARINLLMDFLPAGGESLVDRAIELCDLLMPPTEGGGGDNEYFKDNGRSLLFGLVVWVRTATDEMLNGVPRSLYGVKRLCDSKVGLKAYIEQIGPHIAVLPVDARELLESALEKFLPLTEATFSSAATQAGNPLGFLLSKGWRRALCGEPNSDGKTGASFNLSDFLEPGTDLYLAISSPQLKAYKGVASRLLIGCLANRMLMEAGRGLPTKVRFVLDEVAKMGRIPALVDLVEIGRPVATIFFVVQFFGQLVAIYGKEAAETLLNSFALKLYLSVEGEDNAKRISASAGRMTVVDRSTSNRDGNSSRERGEDVLSVSTILTLETSKSIVSGRSPVRGEHSYSAIIDRFTWKDHPHYRALGNLEDMPRLPHLDSEGVPTEEPKVPEQAAAE